MKLHFRPELEIKSFSEKEISLHFPHLHLKWSSPPAGLYQCLQHLISQGETESILLNHWVAGDEEENSLPRFFYFLENLKQRSLLSYTIAGKDGPLVTLVPYVSGGFEFKEKAADLYQLSRFTYLRNKEGTLVCETPLAAAKIILKHPRISELFCLLAQPKTVEVLSQELPWVSQAALDEVLTLLQRASFLSDADSSPALKTWEFHDLLFHTKSRIGGQSDDFGGTFRFLDEIPPLPALKKSTEPTLPLFCPNIEKFMEEDLPFTAVLEKRTSIREQGKKPITSQQLGEFLYRTARVKQYYQGERYDFTKRPFPGGGACYELELYPLIHACEGIEQGLYRYQPDNHALSFCAKWDNTLLHIAELAASSTKKSEVPQVVILIAARFQRVSWKYQSMAYALILKNTGVLMQTMYLVATAMNLAPCAVGGGNSDLFAKASKIDPHVETTVGEFILGSHPG